MKERQRRAAIKSAVREAFWRAWLRLGGLRRFETFDPGRVGRLVFVCKGNVCRSPYAEWLARAGGFEATSAGFATRGGVTANPVAVAVAGRRGADLTAHRSTQLFDLDLGPQDLLVAMEPSHARRLARMAARAGAQVTLIGLWARPPAPLVADPFGQAPELFETCFDRIDAGMAGLLERLRPHSAVMMERAPWATDCSSR